MIWSARFFAIFKVLGAAIKLLAITHRFEFWHMQAALRATYHVGCGCDCRISGWRRGFGATPIIFDNAISQPNGQRKKEKAEEVHKSPF